MLRCDYLSFRLEGINLVWEYWKTYSEVEVMRFLDIQIFDFDSECGVDTGEPTKGVTIYTDVSMIVKN